MTSTAIERTPALLPAQIDDLRRSGLTDETICEAGIHSEGDHLKLSNLLGYDYSKRRGAALVIPYRERDGQLNGYARIKPLFPTKDRNGRLKKYLAPAKSTNRAYFPFRVIPILDDVTVELLVVKGEKKALCCMQEGFWAIGLGGVFNWKDGRKVDRLIPDLEGIKWNGRPVRIVYDSGCEDKPQVQDAESRLAAQLKIRGAVVKVVRLPDGPQGAKQGADDFLVAHGKVKFRKLIDKAQEPEEPGKDSCKIKADRLDPMDEGRRFLERCATLSGQRTLHTHRGFFYAWNTRRYREISADEIKSKLYIYLDSFAFQLTRTPINNILAAIRALTFLSDELELPCWLDGSGRGKDFIAMQNGILDVQAVLRNDQRVLLPHTPDWFSAVCLPYAYDPAALCPKWIAALERNLEGDQDRIAILQEWTGLNLVNDTSFQKFLTITGEGGNGKSVYCGGLTGLLGEENVSHLPLEAFGERFKLWETHGKLANIAAEISEIDRVAEGTLKMFTSGDRMGFERKYSDSVSALPTARVTLSCNTLPRYSDRTSGIWRWQIVVPFRVTITEAEKVRDMDKPWWWKQQGELPGMLRWALVGLHRLRTQGRFTTSEICDAELARYRRECNPAALFLAETCTPNVNSDVVTADVYRQYVAWCDKNGFRKLASNSFGTEIRRAFPTAQQEKVWNRERKRVEGYKGISFCDELQNKSDDPGR